MIRSRSQPPSWGPGPIDTGSHKRPSEVSSGSRAGYEGDVERIDGGRGASRACRLLATVAVVCGFGLLAQAQVAAAATFTVTNTEDSGAGSLRQAITEANASAGNTIAFAIPGTGPFVIKPASALPAITTANTTINGCSEPGASCAALPLTIEVQLSGQGLAVDNDGVTIEGLSITGATNAISTPRVAREAKFLIARNLTVAHDYLGVAPNGTAAGNSTGVFLEIGNRVDEGLSGLHVLNNVISANTVRGIDGRAGNFGTPQPASGVVISGNLVGLDPSGTKTLPNGGDGVDLDVTGNSQITNNKVVGNGGVGIAHFGRSQTVRDSSPLVDPGLLIQGNVVEGNAGGGIVISARTSGLGVDPYSGPVNVYGNTVVGNGGAGITVAHASDTIRPNLTIGGLEAGQPNTIAGNKGAGVAIGPNTSDTSVAVAVRGNSISANTGPRIELAGEPALANGPAGTTRSGPNHLVNHPGIIAVGDGPLTVEGTYEGPASATVTLDFYTSETAEGPQTWIGSREVTTNAAGTASYRFTFATEAVAGLYVETTATDAGGDTSEFTSAAVSARPTATCTSDPNVFNTGYNAATGGFLPDEAKDANWQVAGPYFTPNGTTPPAESSLPPGTPAWAPANGGNLAEPFWPASPYGDAQWISQQTKKSPKQTEPGEESGDWYYMYQFTLDPSVSPASFSLQMNFLADNDVAQVFVNGVAQSGLTTGIPQNTENPYFYGGFHQENAAQTTLDHDWQTGLNTIIVEIKSGPPEEGFDAQVRPSAVCPVNLAVTKTASRSRYAAGQPLTYTVTATNAGPGSAAGVTISDPLPAGLASGGFTWTCAPSPGSSCTSSGSGSINDGKAEIAAGGSLVYTVTGTVPVGLSGPLTNTATVTPPPGSEDPGCTPSCAATVVVAEPQVDVAIAKTASRSTVPPGGQVMYTLTVQNKGPSDGTGVTVTDKPPAGLTYVSAVPSQGTCSLSGGALTCPLGTLPAGASAQVLVTAEVGAKAPSSLKNTATVTVEQPDTDPANNTATQTVTVKPQPSPPAPDDVAIVKTASAPTVIPGGQIVYTLLVRNNGPGEATGVTVTDTPPGGLTATEARSAQGTCTVGAYVSCALGALAPGGETQILISTIASAGASGSLKNVATVTSDEKDTDPANNLASQTITVPPPPYGPQPVSNLRLAKRVSTHQATAGARLTYTIEVTNLGPAAADDVHLTDAPDLPLKLLAVHAGQGNCLSGPPLTCSLGTVPAGAHVKVTVQALAEAAGQLVNSASVTSTSQQPSLAGVLALARTKVAAVLQLRKSATPGVVRAGGLVTFHIAVTNPLSRALHRVSVCDTLPEQLVYVRSTPSAHAGAGVYCWHVAKLSRHATSRVTLLAEAPPGSHGTLVNHATATAPGIATADAKARVRVIGGASPCAVTARRGPAAHAAC